MDHYLDIKIVPDEEVPVYFIRNKIYTKLHKALFSLNSTDIGVSFPNYKIKLGNVIRLHSSENSLSKLQNENWLGGLTGYCAVSEIQPIPDIVSYRTISRKQANMTAAKLRRLIKRGSITAAEANQYKAKMFANGFDDPYLELESTSNGNKHRRYIVFGELTQKRDAGSFDQFGLSKEAMIPWFI